MRNNSIISAAISILIILHLIGCAVDLTAERSGGNWHIELKAKQPAAENGGDANAHST